MKNSTKLLCVLGSVSVAWGLGCAPAYHSYSGGYVDCHYCPPPAMLYSKYNECVCHSYPALSYLHASVAEAQQSNASVTPQPPDESEAPQPPEVLDLQK